MVSTDNVCKIEVYNGTWVNVSTDCNLTEGINYYNISNIITNETQAEEVEVNITYQQPGGAGNYLFVDYVFVNISYLPPFSYSKWNLTNATGVVPDGKNFSREEWVNVSANWSVYDSVVNATVEHNGTGSFVNYTLTPPFTNNWTNYTLDFSNYTQFPLAGNITVYGMHANDSFGQENSTVGTRNFVLWGYADLANVGFVSSYILNWSNATVLCNVTDSNSSSGIPNYNVSFYRNGSYMGWNLTNSSGIARYLYQDLTNITNSTSVDMPFSCNITDQQGIFYYSSGQDNSTSNLTIGDVFKINISGNWSTYNRGDNITIKLLDTSNNTILNVTWYVNTTKYNETTKNLYEGDNDTYTFNINSTDPIGNWTLFANASKTGRKTNITFIFNVTSDLDPTFASPASGTQYLVNGNVGNPTVVIYNARGAPLNYTMNVNMTCSGTTLVMDAVYNSTGGYFYYQNTSFTCTAPSTAGSFSFTASASDSWNNSGEGSVTLSAVTSGGGNPPGGGSSSSGGSPTVNCTCQDWKTLDCGAGNCTGDQVYQTRVCEPASCSEESRCIYNPVCTGEMDFNFTLSSEEVQVVQGETESVILTVANAGDLNLNISFAMDKDCCDVPSLNGVELLSKESNAVSVSIHPKLTQETGVYTLSLNITSKNAENILTKITAVKISVLENPLISEIGFLENQLAELESKIQELVEAGISFIGVLGQKEKIETLIANAYASIEGDDLTGLKANVNDAKTEMQNTFSLVESMRILQLIAEYRWYIIIAVIIIIIVSYLVAEILLPLRRLDKEIRGLSREEKSLVKARVETEKQYFKRVIDEKTFKSVLAEGQGKIMRAKGSLSTKKELRNALIKEKLSPRAFGGWIKRGFRGKKTEKGEKHKRKQYKYKHKKKKPFKIQEQI
jgi:hypothetical protein